MAQKKKTNQQQQSLSPAKYIRLKGRSLPVVHCYINTFWKENGLASIIVVRQHQSGNYTTGQYLVDTFCLGVKDTAYCFNISSEELSEMIDVLPNNTEITYAEVHNIIFGAMTYAQEEVEVAPHRDFELTQYLLEEDTDDIPLIEYYFGGSNNRPYLVVDTRLEASKYLPKLQQKYGNSFTCFIKEDQLEDQFEEEEEEERL